MKIAGSTVLITGAGNGMGRQLAIGLIQKGAKVAALDINQAALDETKKLANATDSNYRSYLVDITDSNKVATLPQSIANEFSTVNILINNAGIIQPFVKINELDISAARKVMDINFFAPFNLIKAFLPSFLKQEVAHIVNTSSMGAYTPVPGQSLYGASKAALAALTAGLHSELIGSNVFVTTVYPGAIATNIAANSGIDMKGMDASSSKIKMTSAFDAARVIIAGIEKNKARVFIGKDAKLMNLLTRINPLFAAKLIQKQMKDLL
jgi:short-subunit dehydrogenase